MIFSLDPINVWEQFANLSSIPRASKNEEAIRLYLFDFAKKYSLLAQQDATGNVLITKKTSQLDSQRPTIALQSHMDMVCEKEVTKQHDFTKDPITLLRDADWIKADGTTLGADNGIGMALQLAVLMCDEDFGRDIECLFTVDEETGLTGAFGLEKDFLSAPLMINLDSEQDDEIFIGCAGGCDTIAHFSIPKETLPSGYFFFEVSIHGLQGGHSGDDIEKKRANANQLLNTYLLSIADKYSLWLGDVRGGSLRNAIPREAYAWCAVPRKFKESVRVDWNIFIADVEQEWLAYEPSMRFVLSTTDAFAEGWSKDALADFLQAVSACPHGVINWSEKMPTVVQTSTNLAVISSAHNGITVATNQRSLSEQERDEIAVRIRQLFELCGAEVLNQNYYPGWEPRFEAAFLKHATDVYTTLFGQEPTVRVIHAGLECGVISGTYPAMDIISIGPTIKDAHSPNERVSISSVQKIWEYLLALLR